MEGGLGRPGNVERAVERKTRRRRERETGTVRSCVRPEALLVPLVRTRGREWKPKEDTEEL